MELGERSNLAKHSVISFLILLVTLPYSSKFLREFLIKHYVPLECNYLIKTVNIRNVEIPEICVIFTLTTMIVKLLASLVHLYLAPTFVSVFFFFTK